MAAVLPAPGHGGLWGTPGRAGEGDIFPYVGHHIDRRFGEQRASCGKSQSGAKFPLCTFSGAARAVWRLCGPTSNLQGNSGSGGSGWAAGHTAVLTAVNLLHPSNAQGPAVNVLLHEGSGANLKLTLGTREKNKQII